MNTELTEIAFILDRSSSMLPLTEAAITGFNSFLDDQLDTPGEALLSLVLFDDEYTLHANRAPLTEVRRLDTQSYIPRGTTSLLDAIGRTIETIEAELSSTPENERPASVTIAIYTDGYENTSTDYSAARIRQMIKHQTEQHNWQFLYLAANEDAIDTAAQYGIDKSSAARVFFSKNGMQTSTQSISRKIKASRARFSQVWTDQELIKDADANLSDIVEQESN
ncbi:MAG: vWA domain-containing protein [Rubritalea sp.]|uniref:vWA domain-containing protein n=1 Tax=Rubritalea sp. TaxID=2109375 RepID=UPI00324256AB